jgi:hypothetical protein
MTIFNSIIHVHDVVSEKKIVAIEKKFVLHISHRVAMLNYVPRWRPENPRWQPAGDIM